VSHNGFYPYNEGFYPYNESPRVVPLIAPVHSMRSAG
jgi:hypothetical protein